MCATKIVASLLFISTVVIARPSSGAEPTDSLVRSTDEASGVYETPYVYRRSIEGSAMVDEIETRSSDSIASGASSDFLRTETESSGLSDSITKRNTEASGLEDFSTETRSDIESSGAADSIVSRRSVDSESSSGSGEQEFRSLTCACILAETVEVFESDDQEDNSSDTEDSFYRTEGSGTSGQSPVAYVHEATTRSDDGDLEPVAAITARRIVVCKCNDEETDGSGSGLDDVFRRSADFESSGAESTITRRNIEASGLEDSISTRSSEASGDDYSDVVRRSTLDSESSGFEESPITTRARRYVESSGSSEDY
ncbi:hypothetical protein M3Y94_00149300 [Aphelenchoides besseyi]|nr:hypothetical protein M3Y94_00149300 [Aphelenchoides besseyi]KAI6237171.1 hypothetical protein M3Y95_00237100 [Aphelenchoides besseyi]